ncbi:MAG: alpha-hydroxy-acid oxidizing protein [Leptospiraceae bacterium]|nr:alpha-hydroxy-acid oxidizing protein [Leptospiraceae bacterium]MCP5497087.1 alpha-hydroxy-acid oxidizing protein [Leptospiraceae bacterium]
MKLHTLVADMNPEAPGMKVADSIMIISTKDLEGMVREAKRFSENQPIHAVITAGTDASMTVAAVANYLGLPGIRYVDAEAATNKIKMRKRLKEHNVPIPNFASIWSLQDARDSLEYLKFPLVLKPADNMGARGVIKINNREELQTAFKHSKKFTPSGEMILEEYMEGPEVSVDALAWNGNIKMTGIADRIIEKEPYFIEMGHNMPSSLPSEVLEEVERVMKAGMRALGITIGAGKGDIKVTKNGVMVGEIAARLSGGFMSAYTYPFSTGINLNKAAIQISLGEEPEDLEPKFQKVSIERALLANPGKLLSISGVEQATNLEGVNEIFLMNKPGDIINEPTNNIEKAGHVIVTSDSLEKAESIFQKAQAMVHFESDDFFIITEKAINQRARLKFGKEVCWVCKVCDGTNCASGVPGMGGVGNMETFKDNINALKEYFILPRYIRDHKEVDTSFQFLNKTIRIPMMAAPMTGAITNMNAAMDEYEYATTILKGCMDFGSIGWLGDGASPEKYKIMIKALDEVNGHGILICKPRMDEGMLQERFREAEKVNTLAVGMDIDAFNFKTMILKNQKSVSRSVKELEKIRKKTKLPFILKGIMSKVDAMLALEMGADCIVVSNHGGRILDDMPGTARVIANISETVKGKLSVLVDGGVRSGIDIFKMIALGADGVLVGRPFSIFTVGGGIAGIKLLIQQYGDALKNTMTITGASKLKEIHTNMIMKK